MLSPTPTALLAFVWSALLIGNLPAQVGTLNSLGLEPRARVTGRTVGLASELVLDRLVPDPAGSVVVGFSPSPGTESLAPLGFPGSSLGINRFDPGYVQLGPLPVGGAGEVRLPFTVDANWIGTTFYLQVAQLDPLAPNGLALSEVEVVTFGSTDERMVASGGPSLANQTLAMVFADGSAVGPVLPAMTGFQIVDLALAASWDTVAIDGTRPWRDDSEPNRVCVRFPDGSALYHYLDSTGAGFFLVSEGGRRFTHLLRAPLVQGVNPFEPLLAVSPFEPLVAVIGEGNLPGGSPLVLMRVDGENFDGIASPVRGVPFTGLLSGFEPKEDSLTFLSGVLMCTDEATLVRIPTGPGLPPEVLGLPPVAGLAPIEILSEISWAADGSLAALVAGDGNALWDVFLVRPSGPVTNFTQNPGIYESAGFGDVLDGGRLNLSPDGSRVAYVREVGGDPELFVEDVVLPAVPVHVTSNANFVSTIDQEIGVHFLAVDKVSFTAGGGLTDHDAYVAETPSGQVTNVTLTGSGATPFSPGILVPDALGTGAGSALYGFREPQNTHRVVVLDAAGQILFERSGRSAPALSRPTGTRTLVAVQSGSGSELHALSGGTVSTLTMAPGSVVGGLWADSPTGDGLVDLQVGTVRSLLHLDASGTVVTATTGMWDTTSARRLPGGGWLAVQRDPAGASTLVRVTPSGGTTSSLTIPNGRAVLY